MRQVSGTRLVQGTLLWPGKCDLDEEDKQRGNLVHPFSSAHGLSNTVDVSPCNCEVSPGSHRQHSGIQHLNPSSSQVYLETVN